MYSVYMMFIFVLIQKQTWGNTVRSKRGECIEECIQDISVLPDI